MRQRLDDRIAFYVLSGYHVGHGNVATLRGILTSRHIEVVINQWGLPFFPALILKKAAKGLGVKTIAVYHNDPSTNGKLKSVELLLEKTGNPLRKFLLRMAHGVFKQITSASMRYVYRNSDRYVVLSESFVDGFRKFTRLKDTKKLAVITNPVTIETSGYELDLIKKCQEVLFVGRIDNNQKRVFRVVDVWAQVECVCPDWTLVIVGDGPDKVGMERYASSLGLRNIRFEGFRNPRSYYERASLLLLTSEYEGFGLVIVEAMSFGVVPIVLDSYTAVHDILEDGKDGRIVPYRSKEGFCPKAMAEMLLELMENQRSRERMAKAARDKSFLFSRGSVCTHWNKMLKDVVAGGGNLPPLFKQKEIIYVGRLDCNQKRVLRILQTWALLEQRYPDWRLTIVGDGPDRVNLENQVFESQLENVSFEGFQNPRGYYERASILLLTSEFEGFPLVLPECMSFGVVPAVYGSYSAVYDIVEDGKNGLILPYDKKGYNAALMAEKLSVLMQSSDERQRMAENAIVTSRKYSLDSVYQSWEKLFDSLF